VDPYWQEGAGRLLLVAAAQETGLLAALEDAVASCTPAPTSRLACVSPASRRMLLLTLLFLGVVGLRRTWDLRGYTGDALSTLTGRKRAYGYAHVERFLSQVAHAGGSLVFTNALGKWTAHLWRSLAKNETMTDIPPCFYIDGHRKPVYTSIGLLLSRSQINVP
jgi:hypothetical protein